MQQRDYYEALGVAADASADEIKVAFRKLAREHHPDATGGNAESEQRYKEISEAYAVLSDPTKRRQYDNARMGIGSWSSPWGSPFASTIEDIFETFFGGGAVSARTRQRSRAQPGQSIEMLVELSLEEVVFGAHRTLEFERLEPCEACNGQGAEPGTEPTRCDRCQGSGQVQEARRTVLGSLVTSYPCRTCQATGWIISDPCKSCRGSGQQAENVSIEVDIPAGLDDGDRMRLDREGEAGSGGGPRGDLYLRFRVLGDDRFERLGDDLLTWAEIPMTVAALGGEVKIPTLDGEQTLEIHPGTQSTEVFRLKGLGVARRSGRGRGELVVRAHVVTPTKLSKKEKELLRNFASERGEDPKGERPTSVIRRVLGLS
jgi:molecular chaperone DnaJ